MNFLRVFDLPILTHIQHVDSYEIYQQQKNGTKDADWTRRYTRMAGLFENRGLGELATARLALGTFRAPAL